MVIPLTQGPQADDEIDIEEQPSLTYKLDLKKKRIIGMTNDKEAVKQAIFKILQTERFEHLIYTSNYGRELDGLIGTNRLFIQSELKRRITEALKNDDRISDVIDFNFTFGESDVIVTFTALSQYGEIPLSWEVERIA